MSLNIQKIIVGPIETNCYLLVSNNEAVIIDPGAEGARILFELEKSGARLKYIINTHYHYDHVMANEEVRTKTGALVLIHEAEKDYIDFQVDRYLQEGEYVEFGDAKLEVINTPGHSKGSICLLGENIIFTGDTLFDGDCGRVDLAGGNWHEMEESLAKLKGIIKKGVYVYPGHGNDYVQ